MSKMIEKAVFINNLSELRKTRIDDYSLIYIGGEFCAQSIPPLKKLIKALRWVEAKGKRFAFVTPLETDLDIAKTDKILSYLHRNYAACEIIINDFGLLNLIKEKYDTFVLTAGRTLVTLLAYPDYEILNKKRAINFLKSNRIQRVELSYRPSLFIPDRNPGVEISLYFPFIPIASTRFCPFKADYKNRDSSYCGICKDKLIALKHPFIEDKIYLKGNTYFLKYENILRSLDNLKISRLVIQPEI